MCSLNWREFDDHIGLVFTRDEAVNRAKAIPPQRFSKAGVEYLMPIDPVGQGSWIAMNNAGFVVFVLNDYQGQIKPHSHKLKSRGQLIKLLAECNTMSAIKQVVEAWPLERSQPFVLGVLHTEETLRGMVHYSGSETVLEWQELPQQLYSSGDPEVEDIVRARKDYVGQQHINDLEGLIALHQSHKPYVNDEYIYSLCMHREVAESQSLTVVRLSEGDAEMSYYAGSPCQIKPANKVVKSVSCSHRL